jgi:hypothetical protein
MVQQNLQGVEQWHAAAHDQNNSATMMNEAFYNQTAFSGNRFFDDLAVPANTFKSNWASWLWDRRMDREYLLRDVLQGNLGWLALAAGGLALGGRDMVASGSRLVARTVGLPMVTLLGGMSRAFNRPGVVSGGLRQLRRGLLKASQFMLKNLPATVLAGVGAWFVTDRLFKTLDGSAQQAYFRQAFVEGSKGTSSTYSFNPYG